MKLLIINAIWSPIFKITNKNIKEISKIFPDLKIIEYDYELSNIVDTKHELDISSKYEVEIRASQIVVINYIKSKLKEVKAIDINDYLFTYSKKVKNIVSPYHLCRNTNY